MRIDAYLYQNGYSKSRTKAKELIEAGKVSVDGKACIKPSFEIDEKTAKVAVRKSESDGYVGRGGIKLAYALEKFGIDVNGKTCVDIGASTGGFTECLINNGAKKVFAVDSGSGQLDEKLRNDGRVVCMENFNARNLELSDIENTGTDVVVDVSFISQNLIYPAIKRIAKKDADIVTLIKPQFEAGKENIGKHGVVKDEKVIKRVIEDIKKCAYDAGFETKGIETSPIKGGSGNTEYLIYFKNL